MYGVKKCSNFILLHVAVQFSQHHLLKRLSLLHCIYVSHTMVQHRKLRDKSTHLWSLIYDKEGKNIHGEKTISSISGAGITG